MTETSYQIGPLNFKVKGEGALCTAVRGELASALSAVDDPDIVFDFSGPTDCVGNATISNHLRLGEGRYQATHSLLRYVAISEMGSPLVVNVTEHLSNLSSSIRFLRGFRALNWNHLTLTEEIAKNFIYAVFDYSSQIALLGHDATYIHASAIEKHGYALVLAGRGGVGKSSFMLKSVLQDDWRYISDDLAVLDAKSIVWRTPKRMQIYGYNIAGEPAIRDALLKGRSAVDLAAWHARLFLKGGKRVRRRIAAESLFGPSRLAECAVTGTAIFLERHSSDEVHVTEISPKAFAYRCATVLLEELNPFSSISLAEHSGSNHPTLPSVSDLHATTMQVMQRALQTKSPLLVQVPERSSPAALAGYLRPFLPYRLPSGSSK